MKLKVFISHKQEDSGSAAVVAQRLKSNGIDCYLDVVDTALNKDGEDLSDYIRNKMLDCDQLMAVVSDNTKLSWWVPWEIGVATEKSFLISTYAVDNTGLPDYLKKWPYLKSLSDIDTYAKYVKSAQSESQNQRIRKGYVDLTQSERAVVAMSFHKGLRQALGQHSYSRY